MVLCKPCIQLLLYSRSMKSGPLRPPGPDLGMLLEVRRLKHAVQYDRSAVDHICRT